MIREFKEALQDCNLIDLGCKGYPITQGNGRYVYDFVEESLYRFLFNKKWSDRYDDCVAINLEMWTSDYCPVLMEVQEKRSGLSYMRRNALRVHYEDMLSAYKACKDIIERELSKHSSWSHTNPLIIQANK